ncbi:SUR7/PalI family-domain-containing protein [Mycena crocata]|nr:SUR7/PalI family-domain-containing protein [Mycena crocata]
MGCIRPATPGFVLTTLATALLAVVSFCVPYFKSVYFLKAVISSSGVTGTITFGTLGYCVELPGNTTCSSPTVGYELDINSLVGNKLPIEIPNVVVKWLTYVLVLHIVALALAAGSAVFGLLAHVREMSMTCCSTCVSGFAAAVALLAFIFDLALFFIAKSRINSVGTASIGNAIWLTLAAWVLLFFSGCFYTLGRCCISKRSKRGDWDKRQEAPLPNSAGEQMRLDAVKAEADRKARQKATEGGLPAFHESQPLTTAAYDDGSTVYTDKPQHTPGGYMQAPPGSRAVDQYYNEGPSAGYNNTAYPPSPQRQYAPSTYAPSTYSYNAPQSQQPTAYPPQQYHSTPPLQHATSPPLQAMAPLPHQRYQSTPPPQQMLSPPQQYAPLGAQAPSQQPNPYLDPAYLGASGHAARGTSYHSAATHHAGEYSQYDPYDSGAQTGTEYYTPQGQSQYTQSQYTPHAQADYTTRGDGYGANNVPPIDTGGYFPQPGTSAQNQASGSTSPGPTSPGPKGPRNHRQSLHTMNADEESPPQYEAGSEHIPGAWGKT